MKLATEKQLRERWETPEGIKARQQVIDHIREDNRGRFLKDFNFLSKVKNDKDLLLGHL